LPEHSAIEAETGKGADALDRRRQLGAVRAAARTAKGCVLVSKLVSHDVAFVSGLMAQRVPFIVAELVATPMLLQLVTSGCGLGRRVTARSRCLLNEGMCCKTRLLSAARPGPEFLLYLSRLRALRHRCIGSDA